MSKGLFVVLGMTIAYFVSFLGLILAYFSYKRRTKEKQENKDKMEYSKEG